MRGEGMAQGVDRRMLVNLGLKQGTFELLLQGGLGGVPAQYPSSAGAPPSRPRREHELPTEQAAGIGIFAIEPARQWGMAGPLRQIVLVKPGDSNYLLLQGVSQPSGQDGCAILSAFACANVDGVGAKVEVFNAQRQAFGDAHAGAVEQFRKQTGGAIQASQHVPNFVHGQYYWEPRQPLDASQAAELANLQLQHVAIQKEDRIERLGLGRSRNVTPRGQVIDEGGDSFRADIPRMPLLVKENVVPDPVPIGFFGTPAEMASSADQRNLIHQARGWGACVLTPLGSLQVEKNDTLDHAT